MQHRRFSFAPGPGPLPRAVMERAQREFLCLPVEDSAAAAAKGGAAAAAAAAEEPVGFSPFELTNLDAEGNKHPGVPFREQSPVQGFMADAERKLRELMDIPPPSEYRVLFMHGGAVGQFSAVPLNIGFGADGSSAGRADYVDTGFWSQRAQAEGEKYLDVKVIEGTRTGADGKAELVSPLDWNVRPDAAFVHVTLNETVQGFEYRGPQGKAAASADGDSSSDGSLRFDWPAEYPVLVGDATSTLLSRAINVRDFGVIYTSGGKNVPAGVTVVIIKTSLLRERKAHPFTPQVMDYRMQGGALDPEPSIFESRPNTPPVFGVYMLGLVLDHLKETHNDLAAVSQWVDRRSRRVYEAIDASDGFYSNKVTATSRSHMSICFRIRNDDRELETAFADKAAKEAGLHFLFGHAVRGGVRITLYNGVPDEAVDEVLAFMQDFKQRHGSE
jgi:phosphoserine aminotransferase